jgi:hypothetical protein
MEESAAERLDKFYANAIVTEHKILLGQEKINLF